MTKKMFRFYTISDYEQEEAWLRRQHARGLRMTKVVPFFYTMEECTPEDVIYRLDYTGSDRPADDYIQMCSDCGWSYFASIAGWHYFRKPAAAICSEGDGELFSDNATRLEMIRRVIRTRLLPLLVIFLFCLLPNLLMALSGTLGAASVFFTVFFSVMVLLYTALIAHCGLRLYRLRQKYGL